jgi:hypothetical protein
MAKPFINRLLVKNHNNESTPEEAKDTPVERAVRRCTETQILGFQVAWKTPTKSQEIVGQLRKLERMIQTGPTARLLFRKIQKAYEMRTLDLVTTSLENKRQASELENLRRVKRKKVHPDPNHHFVTLRAVRAAGGETEASIEIRSESPDSGNHSDTGSCIVVR